MAPIPRRQIRAESDLSISRVALGCMRLGDQPERATPDGVLELIDHCLELGVTTFDHADIYGSFSGEARMHAIEALFGRALAARPGLRDRIEIVTKCGIVPDEGDEPAEVKHYDLSAARIRRQAERSLCALGTDRIDLLLLHRPDYLMRPMETAHALEELVRAGDVRAVGLSNFSRSRAELLADAAPSMVAAHQFECSVLRPEALDDGTLDHCVLAGMVPMAWSPLGGRRLFGDAEGRAARVRAALESVAARYGLGGADQAALAWLLSHPAEIVPVLGTTRPERVSSAAAAMKTRLERPDWYHVLEATLERPVP